VTDVQRLPYREPPPRLTATARSQSLEQHYQGFLAANLMSEGGRYDLYPLVEDETVADIVLYVGLLPSITFRHLKKCAKRVRRLTKGVVTHTQAVELLAKALGYRTYASLCAACPEKTWARSIRTGPPVQFSMDLITGKKTT